MKISNYSLNYSDLFSEGRMDVFGYLEQCRMLGVEGASLHIRNLPDTQPETLKRVRRAYLDQGLSVSLFSTSANFSKPEAELPAEHEKAREAVRTAAFLGAPLLRVFPGGAPQPRPTGREFSNAPPKPFAGSRKMPPRSACPSACRTTITMPCVVRPTR